MDNLTMALGKEAKEMAKENYTEMAKQQKVIGKMTNFHAQPDLI